MRNRWGVEIKKGHWVFASGPRGGRIEGRVVSVDRSSDMAKAYGAQVKLDSGQTVGADDISQTLGPMEILDDGTVRQNPARHLSLSWDTFGGGTGAYNPEHNSYSARSGIGTFYVDPPQRRGDSWVVRFSNDLGRMEGGLWRELGAARSAASAKKIAADWLKLQSEESAMVSATLKEHARRSNPLTRVRIKSPPQRPAGNTSAPSKRLIARRKKTAKAAPGVYANPVVKPIRNRKAALTHGAPDTMRTWNDHYIVQRSPDPDAKAWDSIGVFPKRVDAENFARNYARQHSTQYVRVVTPD